MDDDKRSEDVSARDSISIQIATFFLMPPYTSIWRYPKIDSTRVRTTIQGCSTYHPLQSTIVTLRYLPVRLVNCPCPIGNVAFKFDVPTSLEVFTCIGWKDAHSVFKMYFIILTILVFLLSIITTGIQRWNYLHYSYLLYCFGLDFWALSLNHAVKRCFFLKQYLTFKSKIKNCNIYIIWH